MRGRYSSGERAPYWRASLGEGQKLRCQRGRAAARLCRLLKNVGYRIVLPQLHSRQRDVTLYDREEIVEVMRNPSRQNA